VQPNTGPPNAVTMARLGTMTIAGLTFTATQKGCSFSLDHGSKCFPPDGGPDSVQVTTGSATACTWFPIASASWISIVGVVGPGNGHFDYAVAQNGPTARTATISVGDQVFVVNQDGVTSCAFPLSPLSQAFGADGGNGIINVSSPQCSPCSWTAVSNDPWISITSGASSSQVRYSVTADAGFAARKGSISVAGQTFLISQSPAICDYIISPSGQSFSVSGGTGNIEMTATPGGCTWTAGTNANWIRVTFGGSGSGDGTIGYSVDPNPDGPARSDIITVADQKFTVNQGGGGCLYSILPASAGFGAGGGQGDVAIN